MNNKYYLNYLIKSNTFPQSIYHAAKNKLVSQLITDMGQNARILDAACGAGNVTGQYANSHLLTGIDNQSSAIDYCKKNYSGEYILADLHDIPLPDNTFDLILFLDSIEHFIDPLNVLKELQRVLKPKGKILICTVNYANPLWTILENTWHRFMADSCKTYKEDVHPTRYTPKLLRQHCNTYFTMLEFEKKIMAMELFYIGSKI